MRKWRRKLETKKSCTYVFGRKGGCTEVLIPASGPHFQFQRAGKEKMFKSPQSPGIRGKKEMKSEWD
jgi:hypothetical protein